MTLRRRWRLPSSRDCQSCADGADVARPGAAEHRRARFHGRARRNHVVHDHHGPAVDRRTARSPMEGQREGVIERAQAAGARERDLPAGMALATECPQDGYAEVRREIVRLVEPAPVPPQCVQRDGHGDVGAAEPVAGDTQDELRQGPRKRPAPFVLEGMDDLAERAGVQARRAPGRRRAAGSPAVSAHARSGVAGAESHPTALADRRLDAVDSMPAAPADDPAGGAFQRVVAGSATRRPRDGQDRIEGSRNRQRRHRGSWTVLPPRNASQARRFGPSPPLHDPAPQHFASLRSAAQGPSRRPGGLLRLPWEPRCGLRCPTGVRGRRAPWCRA